MLPLEYKVKVTPPTLSLGIHRRQLHMERSAILRVRYKTWGSIEYEVMKFQVYSVVFTGSNIISL